MIVEFCIQRQIKCTKHGAETTQCTRACAIAPTQKHKHTRAARHALPDGGVGREVAAALGVKHRRGLPGAGRLAL